MAIVASWTLTFKSDFVVEIWTVKIEWGGVVGG
jgi:hypothetical protein